MHLGFNPILSLKKRRQPVQCSVVLICFVPEEHFQRWLASCLWTVALVSQVAVDPPPDITTIQSLTTARPSHIVDRAAMPTILSLWISARATANKVNLMHTFMLISDKK